MSHEREFGEAAVGASQPTAASRPSDQDICDAYLYLLGRLLVLRQEHFDLISGTAWNELLHRDASNPQHTNLDVATSEAWVAVDETSCTIIDLPRIIGRYYTVQILNLWGETIANINERTFPEHVSGSFALCLRGSQVRLPADVLRIDLPGKKARVFLRIELGADPDAALALQRQVLMRTTGKPLIPPTVGIPLFPNEKLPGVEAFDSAAAVLASEADVNPGMDGLQAKVRAVAALIPCDGERRRVDQVIRQHSWGLKQSLFTSTRDWLAQRVAGHYGSDWRGRTAANLFGIWSNTKDEVVSFKAGIVTPLDGDLAYTITFDRHDLPSSHVKYFWSVTCVDSRTFRVLPADHDRLLLSNHSRLQPGKDGSLTLYFAPKLPAGAPDGNWLATPAGRSFILTWRSYGPDHATVAGKWFPPSVQRLSLK
jgi:hypothetical protein